MRLEHIFLDQYMHEGGRDPIINFWTFNGDSCLRL